MINEKKLQDTREEEKVLTVARETKSITYMKMREKLKAKFKTVLSER